MAKYYPSDVPRTEDITQLERWLREETERLRKSTDDIYWLATIVRELYQVAGYGGIGLDAITPLAQINLTPQVLPFDVILVNDPRGITYDINNDAMAFNTVGIWRMNAKVSLEFLELNAGRRIAMQLWSVTAGAVVGPVFNFSIGRNTDGANLNFNLLVEISDAGVGEFLQLRVFSDSDTFDGVDAIGSIWDANHVAEYKGDLFDDQNRSASKWP